MNLVDLDPRKDPKDDSLTPIGELKKVQISVENFQVMQIGSRITHEEETNITKVLRDNIDLFAWKPLDMLGIDFDIVCHKLSINPSSKVGAKRKCKDEEDK